MVESTARIHLTALGSVLFLAATWQSTSSVVEVHRIGALFYAVCYLLYLMARIVYPLLWPVELEAKGHSEAKPMSSAELWDRELDG